LQNAGAITAAGCAASLGDAQGQSGRKMTRKLAVRVVSVSFSSGFARFRLMRSILLPHR
jgi:hypothetical protein